MRTTRAITSLILREFLTTMLLNEYASINFVDALSYVRPRRVHGIYIRIVTNDDSSCIRSNVIENTFSSNQ
jgi:hypothetical protein